MPSINNAMLCVYNFLCLQKLVTLVKQLIRLTIGISYCRSMLIPHNCFPICIPRNLLPSANFPRTTSHIHQSQLHRTNINSTFESYYLSGRKRTVTVTFSLDWEAVCGTLPVYWGLLRTEEEVGELWLSTDVSW